MDLIRTHLHIGAAAPFSLLHVSDTHLCLTDEQDSEATRKLARDRLTYMEPHGPGTNLEYYRESCRFAREQGATLVHTGDLFDFVSHRHCQIAPQLLALAGDPFIAAGNHEYSIGVGEAFEDEMYKQRSFDRVQAAFGEHDLRFASRVIQGVNLISLDNVYYDLSAHALERFRQERERGLPMLLFFHTPLYSPHLYRTVMDRPGARCAYLLGTPAQLMEDYSDHRFRQQIATPQTRRILKEMMDCPLVRAVFAGHLHFPYEGALENGVMQYVTGAQYSNMARLITVD